MIIFVGCSSNKDIKSDVSEQQTTSKIEDTNKSETEAEEKLAMYTHEYAGHCTDGDKEKLKNLVRQGVEHATNADMYCIVDWHILNEGSPKVYENEAKDFWNQMSIEFSGHNNVLYEICNEPCNGTSWADVKSYANTIIPIIRANDSDAVIIVGTPNWSQYVDQAVADPLEEANVMYALHFYAATHKQDLRDKLVQAHNAGLPIFVSEYGICDASGNGEINENEANQWVELLDSYNISYVCWNLSNKDESSAIISSACSKISGFTDDDLS